MSLVLSFFMKQYPYKPLSQGLYAAMNGIHYFHFKYIFISCFIIDDYSRPSGCSKHVCQYQNQALCTNMKKPPFRTVPSVLYLLVTIGTFV
jgi:hypothetical protein